MILADDASCGRVTHCQGKGGAGSWAEPMFSEPPHRARLWPLFAHFLDEGDTGAHGQPSESAVSHGVAMEIDLAAIAGLEKAEFAGSIEPHHRPDRLAFVMLHLSPQTASVILQTPASPFEGIVEGESEIGVSFIRLRVRSTLTSFPPGRARRILTS